MTTNDQAEKPLFADVRARLEKATPRYYISHPKMSHWINDLIGENCPEEQPFVLAQMNRNMDRWHEDLCLIAHAPTDLKNLLAAIDIAVEALNGITKTHHVSCSGYDDPDYCGCGKLNPIRALAKIKEIANGK